jgi:glucose-6-phosphate dehydrogenase assembly protein OpcA
MSLIATQVLGQEVPLHRVNATVRELWQAESTSKTRASLMNFVIYSEDDQALDTNTHALAEITREHSCRAILLLNGHSTEDSPSRAWVTAHCQLYDGKRSVCCEQLSFALTNASTDEVRNIIFSHVESDLPLIIWWQGALSHSFDERLYTVMDGLIIDSATWADPAHSFHRLNAALADKTTHFALADLAWMRSHTLRNALATACQDPRLLAELSQVNELTLTHAPGARVTALLYAAWVGAQLHCTTAGKALRLQRHSGADIRVTLKEGTPGCALQTVELTGPGVSVHIRQEDCAKFVQATTRHGSTQQHSLLPADLQTDTSLITEQLSRLGGSSRYLEALPLFKQWL